MEEFLKKNDKSIKEEIHTSSSQFGDQLASLLFCWGEPQRAPQLRVDLDIRHLTGEDKSGRVSEKKKRSKFIITIWRSTCISTFL